MRNEKEIKEKIKEFENAYDKSEERLDRVIFNRTIKTLKWVLKEVDL